VPITAQLSGEPSGVGIAPLLKKLMTDYAAAGLKPAYLPKDDLTTNDLTNVEPQ
jgi:hypothetical protein